ncbi:class I SAM-dependent methyltransferase [Hyphomonas sp.]|uniref:class I SAM-dependent methyltransferase n=1 Tax=Hyphomonas sp. TaxID=87 RepID=UPI0030F7315B
MPIRAATPLAATDRQTSDSPPLPRRPGSSANGSDARFWDRMADGYFARPIKDIETYHAKLVATRGFLQSDMDILEFGCGSGGTAIAHAPFVNSVHALDISNRMIEIGRNQAAGQGVGNIVFEQANFDEFDAAPASYDVILGLSILHLVADRDATIAKVQRLLKPGGVFVSSTGCLKDGMSFFKWIAPLGRKLGLMPMLQVFSERDLVQSLEGQGLDIIQQWKPDKSISVFIIAKKL